MKSLNLHTCPVDGKYQAVLDLENGTCYALTAEGTIKHAKNVMRAITQAEYDAAVLKQLKGNNAVQVIALLRDTRAPIEWASPLTLEPNVSNTTGEAYLTIRINGSPVGHWTPSEARIYALGVLEAYEVANCDNEYFSIMTTVGLEEPLSRRLISDLESYRPTTERFEVSAENVGLKTMMAKLLHVADNGFMAPEVIAEEIKRIRAEFQSMTKNDNHRQEKL